MTLARGSHPRFPSASKKRGMARAIEVVEWMKAYAKAREAECTPTHQFAASVFRNNAMTYDAVLDVLKKER